VKNRGAKRERKKRRDESLCWLKKKKKKKKKKNSHPHYSIPSALPVLPQGKIGDGRNPD
jgi:hypothetical protein